MKGYNELTEKTAGLLDISNDHNIGFKLNEAGVVKVVYIAAANEQPEVFKLIGDFYVVRSNCRKTRPMLRCLMTTSRKVLMHSNSLLTVSGVRMVTSIIVNSPVQQVSPAMQRRI